MEVLEITESTPMLLRRMEKKPNVSGLTIGDRDKRGIMASHMTVVTTPGMEPEMHDQDED